MIKFKNPQMYTQASGDDAIQLTEDGNWETFPPFAEKFALQIGATVLRKSNFVDMHLWEIEYEGTVLNFVYDDFPNGVSIEPIDSEASDAINKIFTLVCEQRSPDGI